MNIDKDSVKKYLRENFFTCIEPLASGTFGAIYAAVDREGKDVAVKVIPIVKYWKLEEEVWPTLQHPNILQTITVMKPKLINCTMFVMPRHPFTLHEVYNSDRFKRDGNKMRRIKKWSVEILSALDYLHSKEYCHLDIKSNNILISNDDSAVLCDFSGLNMTGIPMKRHCCPRSYIPPEAHSRNGSIPVEGVRYDMWMYGLLVLEMLTGGDSMRRLNAVRGKILSWESRVKPVLDTVLQERPFCDRFDLTFRDIWVSDEDRQLAFDFVQSFLNIDPEGRPTAAVALQHPFLRGEDRNVNTEGSKTTVINVFDDINDIKKICVSTESIERMFSCQSTVGGNQSEDRDWSTESTEIMFSCQSTVGCNQGENRDLAMATKETTLPEEFDAEKNFAPLESIKCTSQKTENDSLKQKK